MVAFHGEVKTKILQKILALESFTAPELCKLASLEPGQVYPYLAKLTATGFLTREPIESQQKPNHRPLSRYVRTTDEAKLSELRREARVLIPPYPEPPSPKDIFAFSRAQRILDRIDKALYLYGVLLAESLSLKKLLSLDLKVPRFERNLELAQTDLKIAYLDTTGPETGPNNTVTSQIRRLVRYQSGLLKVKRSIHAKIAELKSEEQFSVIVRTAISKPRDTSTAIDISKIGKDDCVTVFNILAKEYSESNDVRLKRSLSEFVAALSLIEPAQKPGIVSIVFATRLLRFGSDTQLAERVIRSQPIEDPFGLNISANIACLASHHDDARQWWCQSADGLLQGEGPLLPIALRWSSRLETGILSKYKNTLLAIGDSSKLKLEDLKALEDELGLFGTVSIVSPKEIAGVRTEAFAVKPLLSDYFDTDTNSGELSRSVSVGVRPLFTYGPITERIGFPGLPALRVGLALVSLGCNAQRAWDLANSVTSGRSLLLLHRAELWDRSAVKRISEIAPANFEVESISIESMSQAAAATS